MVTISFEIVYTRFMNLVGKLYEALGLPSFLF